MVKVKDIKEGDVILVKLPHYAKHTINEVKVLAIKDEVVKLEMNIDFAIWARKKDMKIYEVLSGN